LSLTALEVQKHYDSCVFGRDFLLSEFKHNGDDLLLPNASGSLTNETISFWWYDILTKFIILESP